MSTGMLPSADGGLSCAQVIERGPLTTRALVDALTPVIRARLTRALLRRGAPSRRDLREEVLDLTQQVFLVLLTNEGHVLRSWDPSRGLSLVNFVGLLAERQASATFRGQGSSHRRDELVPPEELDGGGIDSSRNPERLAASREGLEAVFDAARAQLGARGLDLFQALFVEARSVDEVCASTGMNADAVYAWRSRIGRLLRTLAKEMLPDG